MNEVIAVGTAISQLRATSAEKRRQRAMVESDHLTGKGPLKELETKIGDAEIALGVTMELLDLKQVIVEAGQQALKQGRLQEAKGFVDLIELQIDPRIEEREEELEKLLGE